MSGLQANCSNGPLILCWKFWIPSITFDRLPIFNQTAGVLRWPDFTRQLASLPQWVSVCSSSKRAITQYRNLFHHHSVNKSFVSRGATFLMVNGFIFIYCHFWNPEALQISTDNPVFLSVCIHIFSLLESGTFYFPHFTSIFLVWVSRLSTAIT